MKRSNIRILYIIVNFPLAFKIYLLEKTIKTTNINSLNGEMKKTESNAHQFCRFNH